MRIYHSQKQCVQHCAINSSHKLRYFKTLQMGRSVLKILWLPQICGNSIGSVSQTSRGRIVIANYQYYDWFYKWLFLQRFPMLRLACGYHCCLMVVHEVVEYTSSDRHPSHPTVGESMTHFQPAIDLFFEVNVFLKNTVHVFCRKVKIDMVQLDCNWKRLPMVFGFALPIEPCRK